MCNSRINYGKSEDDVHKNIMANTWYEVSKIQPMNTN